MDPTLKTTRLHPWHVRHSANMAGFGGYEMPLWYPSGAKAEHLAVLNGAGLFDTSHMATITLHGRGVRQLLQRCFSKDLERCLGANKTPLVSGRSVYGVFLEENGFVLDDAIVFQVSEADYMLVVNASMGAPVSDHLRAHNREEVVIRDHSDQVGKMDLQGPAAARILARVLKNPDRVFERLPYFSFKGSFNPDVLATDMVQLADGTPLMVSRTGYTGEFGFELFIAPEQSTRLWDLLMAQGEPEGLLSCGLAARDSLRAGAGLPLSHQDIGPWLFASTPWDFVLPRDGAGEFTKDFIGARALAAAHDVPCTQAYAGYDLRKVTVSEACRVTDLEGRALGTVLTCTTDMAIDRVNGEILSIATPADKGRPEGFVPRGLCCGFVRLAQRLPVGSEVLISDGRRSLKVEIRDQIRPDRTARQALSSLL